MSLMLGAIICVAYAKFHNAECHNAEYRNDECHYAECRNDECHYAKCRLC